MNNSLIGTTGVFTITFFLLALRHLLHSIGRTNRDRHIRPVTPSQNLETNLDTSQKNSWPVWPTPPEPIATGYLAAPRAGAAAHRERSQKSAANVVRDR